MFLRLALAGMLLAAADPDAPPTASPSPADVPAYIVPSETMDDISAILSAATPYFSSCSGSCGTVEIDCKSRDNDPLKGFIAQVSTATNTKTNEVVASLSIRNSAAHHLTTVFLAKPPQLVAIVFGADGRATQAAITSDYVTGFEAEIRQVRDCVKNLSSGEEKHV